ncbi:MAG TPA: HAMP domain-containing sensor histidine kinase [Bdellovibrionales bacterium]|nr:HAMP domain-containing sensor histidine kinase [Bdellovibrionales bacterium]
MRTRFFFIILIVLIVVAFGATALHSVFLKRERLELIDQQVRETAVQLLDSELAEPKKINISRAESIISDELGESRIGKIFIIRDGSGAVLFESSSAGLLSGFKIPQNEQWITIERGGKYIRVLNLALPRIQNRTLQVGVVLDKSLVSPSYFSASTFMFVGLALSLGLIVAWLLASFLVRPISSLANFIEEAAQDPDIGRRIPSLPATVKRETSSRTHRKDELEKLVASFERLTERVNRSYDVSRFWSYQMAHELKTPMAVVEAVVNQGASQREISPELSKRVLSEVFDVSDTISAFLSWAEIESSSIAKRPYVVKASRVLSSIVTRLEQVHGGRIDVVIDEDFTIFGDLQQLEQMLGNLVSNACTYSASSSRVTVRTGERSISVADRGPGIPTMVLEKLGEPFNRGEHSASSNQKSTGLGLAYVQSVCRFNGWQLNVQTDSRGTNVRIEFPDVEQSQ